MKRVKCLTTWVLVALMVLEPFAINMAAWAQDNKEAAAAQTGATQAQQGSEQVQDASKTLNSTSEAKKKWYMGSGTKKNIDTANQNLRDSKTQVNDVKSTAKDAAGSVKEIGSAVKSNGNSFEALTKVKA
ncbi:MAG TPA: hypothetical protein PKM25_08065, partial [Candidatus Ozemobacteraceae bacterium]|nr:hypothetical protein [Candidatus Ozemobacteraceae bacterium]